MKWLNRKVDLTWTKENKRTARTVLFTSWSTIQVTTRLTGNFVFLAVAVAVAVVVVVVVVVAVAAVAAVVVVVGGGGGCSRVLFTSIN